MLILLTHPESFPNEVALLDRMLAAHPEVVLHLRKPHWNASQSEQLLGEIDRAHHQRIVLHQHHELTDRFNLKGLHFTAENRKKCTLPAKAVSTSFHTMEEALREGDNFSYFFCSPVFQSISKPDYSGTEQWDISDQEETFRQKAVALGGIDTTTLQPARDKGFLHFAVLGAVWHSEDPELELKTILKTIV